RLPPIGLWQMRLKFRLFFLSSLGDIRLPAKILDGKAIAAQIEIELAEQVADFMQNNGHEPTLAAVLVGDDPASAVYVKNKRSACERVGIESRLHRLSAATTEGGLLGPITYYARDARD